MDAKESHLNCCTVRPDTHWLVDSSTLPLMPATSARIPYPACDPLAPKLLQKPKPNLSQDFSYPNRTDLTSSNLAYLCGFIQQSSRALARVKFSCPLCFDILDVLGRYFFQIEDYNESIQIWAHTPRHKIPLYLIIRVVNI